MVIINNRIHLSVKEVAERQNVVPATVYHWLKSYQLPRTTVVGNILIAEDDLIVFLGRKQDRRRKQIRRRKVTALA